MRGLYDSLFEDKDLNKLKKINEEEKDELFESISFEELHELMDALNGGQNND